MSIARRVRPIGAAAVALFVLFVAAPGTWAQEPIIIDHHCTDLAAVPSTWIVQAKTVFRVTYGHTSHGSQPISGMNVFKNPPGSLYWWDRDGTQGGLSLWDATPSGDLGQLGDVSWAQRTRTLLGTPYNSSRNVVIWSWCGGCSNNTIAGINAYLNAMNQLELDYPQVKFVYMTGHLDSTGLNGNLHARNNQIRDYCRANGKTLFDFADLESYDPDELWVLPLNANDNCDYWLSGVQHNWATEWCAAHPGQCSTCSCAHSKSLNCDRKGRAFWWMLARLAGWPGPDAHTGDLNCDGAVNFDDINPFVLALTDPQGYQAAFPGCDIMHGDCNHDGAVNFDDIKPFVGLLS